jgi:arsenate reductase
MTKVLFVCVHNAGRSQMAEAFFNRYASGFAEAVSAGTMPADSVSPEAVEVMKEKHIDISSQRPNMLTAELIKGADRVVTMGCGVEGVCPAVFVPTEDWELENPAGQPIEKVREIRDSIEALVKHLIEELREEER